MGIWSKITGSLSRAWSEFRIGDGHAAGMGRLGFREAARVLPAFPEQQPLIEEMGVFGSATPVEVTAQRQSENAFETRMQEVKERATEVAPPTKQKEMEI